MYQEYAIRGNSALFKCQSPSFVADHLAVESWTIDDAAVVTPADGIDPMRPSNETSPPPVLPRALFP